MSHAETCSSRMSSPELGVYIGCSCAGEMSSEEKIIQSLSGQIELLEASLAAAREELKTFKVWGTDGCPEPLCEGRVTLFYKGEPKCLEHSIKARAALEKLK